MFGQVFAVLTDIFHKPGFKLQALILQHLWNLVMSPSLTVPLWDVESLGPAAFPSNAAFVRQHTVKLLAHSFPNMHQQQIAVRGPGTLGGSGVGRVFL